MQGYQRQYSYLPLSEFFERLKAEGFTIGVEHFIDAQKLFEQVDFDNQADQRDLKVALCALIATNEEEQETFHQLFDQYFDPEGNWKRWQSHIPTAQALPSQDWEPPKERSAWPWILVAAATIVLVTAGIMIYRTWLMTVEVPPPPVSRVLAQPPPPPPPVIVDSVQPPPPAVPDLNVLPFEAMAFYDPDLEHLRIKSPWWNEYGYFIKWWLVLVMFVVFAFYEIYLHRKRKLILKRQTTRTPATAWQVKVDDRVKVDWSDGYHDLLHQMRKRITAGDPELDVQATALATARNAGRLSVQFSQKSRPSEFLVLLDKDAHRNQQVALIEFIVGSLAKADVHLTTFTYEKSPQQFTDPQTGKKVSLQYLLYHYPEHRLILFTSGAGMINPAQQTPFDWVLPFANFAYPTIFTHIPVAQWEQTERALSSVFTVLPAHADGMADLTRYLDVGQAPNFHHTYTEHYNPDEIYDPSELPGDIVARLKQYCGRTSETEPDLFDWLCACCIYHDLFWDLTLHLGKTISPTLLTQNNLQQLTRLRWFRQGAIPEGIRLILLTEAEQAKRPAHNLAVQAVNKLLKQSGPEDKNSLSYDEHRMHLVVTELMLNPAQKERRKLIQELQALRDTTQSQDITAMRYLKNTIHTPLDHLLPQGVKDKIFTEGLPYRGLTRISRLVMFVLLFVVPIVVFDLSFNESTRYNFTYMSYRYNTDTGYKKATFNMHLASFHNNSKPLDSFNTQVEDLLDEAAAFAPDHPGTMVNQFRRRFNMGLLAYHEGNFGQAMKLWKTNRQHALQANSTFISQQSHYQNIIDSLKPIGIPNDPALFEAERRLAELEELLPALQEDFQTNLHALGVAFLYAGRREDAWQTRQLLDPQYLEDYGIPNLSSLFEMEP